MPKFSMKEHYFKDYAERNNIIIENIGTVK